MDRSLPNGLTEKEARIYDALLRNGKLNLTSLARISGIKKTTLYLHLEHMLARDIIKQSVIGKRKFYYPESPATILKQLETNAREFSSALPELMQFYQTSRAEPGVVVYSGKDGFSKAIAEVMRGSLVTKNFWSPRRYLRMFQIGEDRFEETAQAEGVTVQLLLEHSPESDRFIKIMDRSVISKAKVLPPGYDDLPISVIVSNGKIAFLSYDDLFCIVIHNRIIAGFVEVLFDNLWKQIK